MPLLIYIHAGLGKKTLAVYYGDTEDLHKSIIDAFPQLSDAGGYELLRLSEVNRRSLELIPVPPSGYSAEYHKECVHQAMVYVRPIQRNLCEDELPLVEVCSHAVVLRACIYECHISCLYNHACICKACGSLFRQHIDV